MGVEDPPDPFDDGCEIIALVGFKVHLFNDLPNSDKPKEI